MPLYRKKIAQLRLSAHKLDIEVGRHKDIDRNNRICMYCRTGEIETEEHFLFGCPNYKREREMFLTELILHDDGYKGLTVGIGLLNRIFSSKDHTVFILFGKYLTKCWEVRHSMCSNLPKTLL